MISGCLENSGILENRGLWVCSGCYRRPCFLCEDSFYHLIQGNAMLAQSAYGQGCGDRLLDCYWAFESPYADILLAVQKVHELLTVQARDPAAR